MSAYYLKTVMPAWNLALIFRGMAQFMVIQVVALGMIIGFPSISLWLPRLLYQNWTEVSVSINICVHVNPKKSD